MATAKNPDKVTKRPSTVKKASAAKNAKKKSSSGSAASKPAKKAPASKATKTTKKASAVKAASRATTSTRKATKAPARKAATKKKAPAKKAATKRAPAKKAATKRAPAKKAAAMKATAKPARSPYKAKFVEEMKGKLEAERAKYLHSAEEYRAEADALIDAREPGDVQFDEEGGEGDTLAVERERDLALSNQARHAVDQIDAALERIASGTYGLCVRSGQPIPQERLRAIPWAAERVEFKAGGLGRL